MYAICPRFMFDMDVFILLSGRNLVPLRHIRVGKESRVSTPEYLQELQLQLLDMHTIEVNREFRGCGNQA